MPDDQSKMGFNATWSMAVGGMVGGGIFSVLGVIIGNAAQWAWLSFIIAGGIAAISAHSYSQLSIKYKKSGGAFTFLNEINHEGFAGSLAWVLLLGYVLTMSVYAYTFGHYIAYVLDAGTLLPRILAFSVIAILAWVNTRGVGDASGLEIFIVWGKLFILLGIALYGLISWQPEALTEGITLKPWHSALLGAATIFMAYEGFELLSYDYDDIDQPDRTLPRATLLAVFSVIFIYVLVTFGATMAVGASALVEQQEVALAVAGKQILGLAGLILVTIAAAFSTGSAINATMFSTARMMEKVAEKKDLPHLFIKENTQHIPIYAVLTISALAAVLAVLGSLESLVDSASITFLFTFCVVNVLAFQQNVRLKWLCLIGALGSAGAIAVSAWHQLQTSPVPLLVMTGVIVLAFVARPWLLRRMREADSNRD